MTEKTYRQEMDRANTMYRHDPDRREYWIMYMRGLRRAYHGKSPLARDAGEQGYNDAFAFASSKKRGRRKIGDATLDRIRVPQELKDALAEMAKKRLLSVADLRREAYMRAIADGQ